MLAREDGDRAVALAARGRELTVTVLAPDGTGLSGLGVTVAGRPAEACGPGCYRATLAKPRRDVAVRLLEQGRPSVVRFELPARAQPAAALVRRATRVFRSLRSVVVHERLASNPRNALRTRFVMQAPDRLSYRTSAGSEAVVVGRRRWDRTGKGRWVESAQSRLTLPEPFWSSVRDARLLEPGPVARVTFFDPKITAWFDIRVDTRTGRTLTTRMTAASHFMRHRYTDFDSAPPVRPPALAKVQGRLAPLAQDEAAMAARADDPAHVVPRAASGRERSRRRASPRAARTGRSGARSSRARTSGRPPRTPPGPRPRTAASRSRPHFAMKRGDSRPLC